MRLLVVANPVAGGGRTAERLPDIERALRRQGLSYELACTQRPGHAMELARAARSRDVDVIAVAGGDGTLNEVAQAYVDDEGKRLDGPDLAIIPSGSASDFRKTLDLSGSLEEAVAQIRFGHRRPVDLGVLHAVDHTGRRMVRAFVNVASFGMTGAIAELGSVGPKWLGGTASHLLGAVRALASHRNVAVRLRIDGVTFFEGRIFAVAIANGRYFSGGMKIAPHADPSDGKLEVVVLGDLAPRDLVTLAPKIFAGGHLGMQGVSIGSGRAVEAEPVHAWASVSLDVDGEAPGRLPMRALVEPGALSFRG